MAAVDRDVGTKPLTDESLLEAANREIVPVLRSVRRVVNAELRSTSATVGDGVALTYTIPNTLGTDDLFVQLKDATTGMIYDRSDGYSVLVGLADVTVTAPAPVAVDGLRVSIRV